MQCFQIKESPMSINISVYHKENYNTSTKYREVADNNIIINVNLSPCTLKVKNFLSSEKIYK